MNRAGGGILMGHVRLLLSIAGLAALSACAGPNRLGSNNLGSNNLKAGIDPNNSSSPGSHAVAGGVLSKETSLTPASSDSPGGKLIALTFDDGPRPYVLFGSKAAH